MMAERRRQLFELPQWVSELRRGAIGPGLMIPPLFLTLLLCVAPRPVMPPLPLPQLDPVEADRHIRSVADRTGRMELAREDREVIASWRALIGWAGPGEAAERDHAQMLASNLDFDLGCARLANRGEGRFTAVGEFAALDLTLDVARLEIGERPRRAPFLDGLRRAGLLDQGDRLKVHPLAIFALAKASWRERCGVDREQGLAPLELDALDIVLISFGHRLPQRPRLREERLRSLDRFGARHPGYPTAQARASVLLASGDHDGASVALQEALALAPGDRALRNYMIFTHDRWR